jgi:hypothetical protein
MYGTLQKAGHKEGNYTQEIRERDLWDNPDTAHLSTVWYSEEHPKPCFRN